MSEVYIYIHWTDRSLADALEIKSYLKLKFTQKEISKFYILLEKFERIVVLFPLIYPISIKNKKIHRAVLSKQLSVFYTFRKNQVIVISVLDNRMSDAKWPKE